MQRAFLSLSLLALASACSEAADAANMFVNQPGPVQPDAGQQNPNDGDDAGGQAWEPPPPVLPGESDASTEPPEEEDPGPPPKCVQKDSQVIMIGDSYINWLSHTFPEDMKRESGQTWRNYAQGGWSMATGGAGAVFGGYIPDQFDDAIAADPDAHTVLMDGGGNDVLVGWADDLNIEKCKEAGSSQLEVCQQVVDRALAAADALMGRAVTAGIRDVVYFFYPHIPEARPIGGPKPNEILDYALPRVREFCESVFEKSGGAMRCHFVDMIPVFENHNPEWFNEDIHPNSKGSAGMAKAIWEKMQSVCVGQKESSGCCEP